MASPPPGMSPQQTQQWSTDFQSRLRREGLNPASFGFGSPAPGQPSQQQPAGQAPRSAGNFSAYAPGQAQSQQSPWATATPYGQPNNFGMNQQQRDQAMTAWTMPKQQLLQWGQSMPQVQSPQPQAGMNPADVWGRNAALVQQINDTSARQQVGTYLGQGAPPQGWGQTHFNPQQMLTQAQQMLQGGWQNPFAQPLPPQSPPEVRDTRAELVPVRDTSNLQPSEQFAGVPPRAPQDPAGSQVRELLGPGEPAPPGGLYRTLAVPESGEPQDRPPARPGQGQQPAPPGGWGRTLDEVQRQLQAMPEADRERLLRPPQPSPPETYRPPRWRNPRAQSPAREEPRPDLSRNAPIDPARLRKDIHQHWLSARS